MALEKLEHYTIRCVNMEQSRDFYRDIVRLKQGIAATCRWCTSSRCATPAPCAAR
jgi:hypothetical protein